MSSVAPSPNEIARDARWLVQALDPASRFVRLVAMDRDAYRSASFLDDRLLQGSPDVRYVPWPAASEAAALVERSDARWIFHIGHVGSTLIARLLGELPGVLSIREPRFLRDIAALDASERRTFAKAAQALYSRTFAGTEAALVKATSFVTEMAAELVPAGGRAVFMYASAPNYIASILAGEQSRKELHALAEARSSRLEARARRLEGQGDSEAHLAAAAWAAEMTALEAAAEAMPGAEIFWVDFDRALAALPETLSELAGFCGFEASPDELRAIATGPLTRRYSKALEFDYSPDLRRELIAEAARAHSDGIGAALAMLERAAQESPLLARALSRSTTEA